MTDLEELELELYNEKLLLQDHKLAYQLFNATNLAPKLLESLNLDGIKYHMRTYPILSNRIKEIEAHIVELQEKINAKG